MKLFVVEWRTLRKAAVVVMLIGFSSVYAYGGGPAQLNILLNKNVKIPVQAVVTEDPLIALTFDVTLGNDYTAEILEALNKHQVRATFFLTGAWVEKNKAMCQKIQQLGHEIGNHSDKHSHMSRLSSSEISKELVACDTKLKAVLGNAFKATFFRPPFGEYNAEMVKVAEQNGMKCILGNIQPPTNISGDLVGVRQRLLNQVENGSIIVLQTGTAGMVELLDGLIPELKQQGTTFFTLSEHLLTQEGFMDRTGRLHLLH